MSQFYKLNALDADGNNISMQEYQNKVILVVNTASKCGFTKQYSQLQTLYDKYKEKGFVVLAFPCNQFAQQEPGDEKEIMSFCQLNYNVSFPLFSKIDVNGKNTHPLFAFLKKEKRGVLGSRIKWNFTKFLINKEGLVIKRYAPQFEPFAIEKDIQNIL